MEVAAAGDQFAQQRCQVFEPMGLKETTFNPAGDLLARLADACCGDARPECPILDELAGGTQPP